VNVGILFHFFAQYSTDAAQGTRSIMRMTHFFEKASF